MFFFQSFIREELSSGIHCVDVVDALHQTENRFDVRNDDEELRDDFGRVQVSHVGVGRMLAGFEQTRLGRLLALIDLFASRSTISDFFGLFFPYLARKYRLMRSSFCTRESSSSCRFFLSIRFARCCLTVPSATRYDIEF